MMGKKDYDVFLNNKYENYQKINLNNYIYIIIYVKL
jgi:hypothetical protein